MVQIIILHDFPHTNQVFEELFYWLATTLLVEYPLVHFISGSAAQPSLKDLFWVEMSNNVVSERFSSTAGTHCHCLSAIQHHIKASQSAFLLWLKLQRNRTHFKI